ncbi:hypothetical protein NPK74_000042 [Salmonella enterica]|uniref:hypothetical protein n=1 Tax=Citrobacter koseri TaxID=545 RepID=UPI000F50B623|nr:hypothetical protein [Citrobacter koseri]EAW4434995.1 hypothetical protein [Salmonella enterica]EDX9154868.1 hypothetical protein [Salmonella enterica subsp. enterica serovar Sandiego]EAW8076980.1 hypothetical protein [Salmonella enterica]EBU3672320.1 hypothetical protein [Salmonella enterica]ECX9754679.1 hypothetical protein [Salmonella enterica]
MNLMEMVKNTGLLDENFRGITTAIVLAFVYWASRKLRMLLYPFLYIFSGGFSSTFLKLKVDDKIEALKIINDRQKNRNKYNVLAKEMKLKQYGLNYPQMTLRVLFDYIYDNEVELNNIGFISYLDCSYVFQCNRNKLPVFSVKKAISHSLALIGFCSALFYFFVDVLHELKSYLHHEANVYNVLVICSLLIVLIVMIRLFYILILNAISIFLAFRFSLKLNLYYYMRRR